MEFTASSPGRYTPPANVEGVGDPFGDHVVFAWGAVPPEQERVCGIAYGIDVDLPVEPEPRFGRFTKLKFQLETRFLDDVETLLHNANPERHVMTDEDVATLVEDREINAEWERRRQEFVSKRAKKTKARNAATNKTKPKKAR